MLYREPGAVFTSSSIGKTFTCDTCGLPCVRLAVNQKRHTGRCQRVAMAKRDKKRLKGEQGGANG